MTESAQKRLTELSTPAVAETIENKVHNSCGTLLNLGTAAAVFNARRQSAPKSCAVERRQMCAVLTQLFLVGIILFQASYA